MKLVRYKWSNHNKIWLLRQIAASIFCNLVALILGNSRTWLEPYSSELMSSNSGRPLDSNTLGWIISIMSFSAAVMAIPAGILADRWGRKRMLLLIAPLCLLSWTLVAVSNNVATFYIVRSIQGTVEAITLSVGPVYITEISSPSVRGALQATTSFLVQVGVLYTYVCSLYSEYQTFIYASMSLPIVFLMTFIFMPESPYYYLMKNNKNEASKALSWLRASKNVEEELTSIQEAVEADMSRKVGFKDLFATKSDIRAFLIVQIVTSAGTLSGMMTIIQYGELTYNKAPLLWVTADQLSVIMGVTMCVSSFISIFLSDTVGRRNLVIFSSTGMTLSYLIMSLFYFLHENMALNVGSFVWVMYIGLLSLSVFRNIGAVNVSRAVQSEFFPSHTRGIGGGVTAVIASMETAFILKIYIPIMEIFGVYMNFLIYSIICIISVFLVKKFVPESARKTLDEINKDIVTRRI